MKEVHFLIDTILKSEESEEEVVLLDNIESEARGTFRVYNSLSEYGVLGLIMGMLWQVQKP